MPHDQNPTRLRKRCLTIYLDPKEDLGLDAVEKHFALPKTQILRKALCDFLRAHEEVIGFDPFNVSSQYLGGVDMTVLSPKLRYIGIQFFSDDPRRDRDLAQKLKNLILMVFPEGPKVEVMIRNLLGAGTVDVLELLCATPDIQGDITGQQRNTIERRIKGIAKRSIGKTLRARHIITEAQDA